MFQDPARPRVLLLDDGTQADLARMLALIAPGVAVESCGAPLAAWLPLLGADDLGGLIAPTEAMPAAALLALPAALVAHPELEVLLLVGDRGLAGAEELLGLPRLALLPQPWTPAGLRRALATPASGGPNAPRIPRDTPADPGQGFAAAFVAGAVEGLRDPLASLSGYLQLLEGRRQADDLALLQSAQTAAHEIELILEAAQLASGARTPRPRPVDLRHTVDSALRNLARQAPLPEFHMHGNCEIELDPRFLESALYAGRLYLERFGTGETPRLEGRAEADGVQLEWRTPPPAATPAGVLTAPPPFLPEVFERIAAAIGARPSIEMLAGAVPLAAGLTWAR